MYDFIFFFLQCIGGHKKIGWNLSTNNLVSFGTEFNIRKCHRSNIFKRF